MTEDLISRKAAIDAIYACYIGGKEAVDKAPANDQYAEGIDEAVCAVEQLPSVTPQPCDDAISKGAVLDALRARFGVDFDYGKWWSSSHVLAAVESVPPVTPQEPCEDAISRRTVQDYIAKYLSQYLYNDVRDAVEVIDEYIGELPPVKPQYTDAEIQKMQELEQAEIEKAYELGKAERQKAGHWEDVYVDDRNEWIMFFCENCGHQFGLEDREFGWRCGDPIPWKYCPNCGARMTEPQERSDKE